MAEPISGLPPIEPFPADSLKKAGVPDKEIDFLRKFREDAFKYLRKDNKALTDLQQKVKQIYRFWWTTAVPPILNQFAIYYAGVVEGGTCKRLSVTCQVAGAAQSQWTLFRVRSGVTVVLGTVTIGAGAFEAHTQLFSPNDVTIGDILGMQCSQASLLINNVSCTLGVA